MLSRSPTSGMAHDPLRPFVSSGGQLPAGDTGARRAGDRDRAGLGKFGSCKALSRAARPLAPQSPRHRAMIARWISEVPE
ncbi:uncharacterized protein SOCEGT47_020460 [Sorangium cellulosum]|uniref:Uncharacterized protein n=1 Tax=Sorangium cellulosum TaxID=56 RepID=A0A4P2PXS3_SORCE|nr:uncharacterized protein SOCEGT47_020460 [Sorangium cellulosum]